MKTIILRNAGKCLVQFTLCACAAGGVIPLAIAQIAPDAGSSLRDLQPPLQLAPEHKLDLQLPKETDSAQPVASGGTTVTVSGFNIHGNSVVSDGELQEQLADLLGKPLGLGDLQGAATRLTRYYRSKGYPLARAYIPAQSIEAGVVDITVLEGRYGAINVENRADLRDTALAPLSNLKPGETVQAEALERALLLMNERAGVSARAVLRPGTEVGATNLLVGLDSTTWYSGRLSYDSGGNRFTGADRLNLGLGLNSPLGLGDRLDVQVLGSSESQHFYSAAYQLPVGPWGTSFGISTSYMEYVLGKNFSVLDAHGTGYTGSVFVNQPLIVSRKFWLNARLQYEEKRLRDDIDLFETSSSKRAAVTSLSLDGNARDDFLGGGMTSFSLSWRHGWLTLLSGDACACDALTAKTQGEFNVLAPMVVRLQRLTDNFSLFVRLRGQVADSNLDGSEKFGLGGAYGVRGYPQGEAQGDEGWISNLELRYALTKQWQLSSFADYGHVRVNHAPWDDSARRRVLSSAGFGASWADDQWRFDVAAAWRTTASRPQSDSQDSVPRVWMQAAYLF